MKLHEFFFFLQAHAGIFFSTSISCMNFFFGSYTPLPGYLMVHPLPADYHLRFFSNGLYSARYDDKLLRQLEKVFRVKNLSICLTFSIYFICDRYGTSCVVLCVHANYMHISRAFVHNLIHVYLVIQSLANISKRIVECINILYNQ